MSRRSEAPCLCPPAISTTEVTDDADPEQDRCAIRPRRRMFCTGDRHSARLAGGPTFALLVALATLVAPAGVVIGQEEQEARRKIQEARKHYDAGDYRKVVDTLKAVVEEKPTLAPAHRLLGHAYAQLGKREAAREALVDAVGHGGLTPDVVARLVAIDSAAGRVTSELNALRLLSVLNPSNREGMLNYTQHLVDAGSVGEAVSLLQSLIDRRPSDATAHLQLGNAHLARDRPERALVAYRTAFALGERTPELARTVGDLHVRAGHRRDALPWYERALLLSEEKDRELQLRRARLLLEVGERAKAAKAAQSLTKADASDIVAKAHRLLGHVAVERENPAAAAEQWAKATDGGVATPQILEFLGSYHFDRENFSKAARYLSRRLKDSDGDARLRRFLFLSHLRAGHPDAARVALRKYLEHEGLTKRARRLLAEYRRTTTK